MAPYILPHQDDFSAPEAFRNAGGPRKWNRQQGFYVYREGRLIQSGGWCGIRTLDEHTKLSRISFDFTSFMDEAFKTNVAKMRIQIPAEIKADIKKFVEPAIKKARNVYDRRNGKSSDGKALKKHWTLNQIERELKSIADDDVKQIITLLFVQLRVKLRGKTE